MLLILNIFIPAENDAFEKGVVQSLLLKSVGDEQDIEGDQECDGSEEAPEESRRPGNSIVEAYRLFTPSVKVCGVPFCFQGSCKSNVFFFFFCFMGEKVVQ